MKSKYESWFELSWPFLTPVTSNITKSLPQFDIFSTGVVIPDIPWDIIVI